MQPDSLSIPLTTATITLALLILINLAAVIWTSARLSTQVVAVTARQDDQQRDLRAVADRVADQGERIAALESREQSRGGGSP